MKISDTLSNLSHDERIRTMSRLEGMSMAMRILNNRASDLRDQAEASADPTSTQQLRARENEIQTAISIVRLVQVAIGNGSQKFGELKADEIEEIMRIY